MNPETYDEKKIKKVAPNPTLKFWRELGQELVKTSIDSVENASKQMIGVVAILEGLYFHAITYADLQGKLQEWEVLLYLLPIVLWTTSLWFSLSVFFPHRYRINISASDICKSTYEEIARQKLTRFRISSIYLGIGCLSLLPAITLYLT